MEQIEQLIADSETSELTKNLMLMVAEAAYKVGKIDAQIEAQKQVYV